MQSRRALATYSPIRRWIAFALMCLASPIAIAQSLADGKAQESLLASTWKGDILGIPFVGYFLDENLLVTRAGDQKPRFERSPSATMTALKNATQGASHRPIARECVAT